MTKPINPVSCRWMMSQGVIEVNKENQVLLTLQDGRVFVQPMAECLGTNQLDSKKLHSLRERLKEDFYPVLHRYDDGSIDVTFKVRGVGGGGSWSRCWEDPEEEQQETPRVFNPSLNQPLLAAPVVSSPYGAISEVSDVDLSPMEGRIVAIGEKRQEAFSEYADTYIPVKERKDGKEIDILENAEQFLQSEQRVFLLLGEAGVGKSLFLECLCAKLWKKYSGGTIPLFISLPALKNPQNRCIEEALEKEGFSAEEIAILKLYKKFVFILDAYDELGTQQNIIVSNRLTEWNAKIIISCRSQHLGENYLGLFAPQIGGRVQHALLREKTVSPFSPEQAAEYIKNQVALGKTGWDDWTVCQKQIDTIPGLAALVQNPFVLTIVVQVLPEVLIRHASQIGVDLRLTRNSIYGVFLEQWFLRQQKKLEASGQLSKGQDLRSEFYNFSKRLAHALHQKGICSIRVEDSLFSSNASASKWNEFFSEEDPQLLLIRSGCPLRRVGNQWSFVHITLFEFLVSEELFVAMQHAHGENEEQRAYVGQILLKLNEKLLVNQPSIIQFSADRVRADKRFEKALFEIIHLSSLGDIDIAAANAMTILNAARISFARMVFKGVQIPKADIPGANLDGTKFIDCNVEEMGSKDIFIKETLFKGCQMKGLKMGQAPTLFMGERANKLAMSPDGRWIAVATYRGQTHTSILNSRIVIFDRYTFRQVIILDALSNEVGMLEFSLDGAFLIVSAQFADRWYIPNEESHKKTKINYRVTATPIKVFRCGTWKSHNLSNQASDIAAGGIFEIVNGTQLIADVYVRAKDYYPGASKKSQGSGLWDFTTGRLIQEKYQRYIVSPNRQVKAVISESKKGSIPYLSLTRVSDSKIVLKNEAHGYSDYQFLPDSRYFAFVKGGVLHILCTTTGKLVKKIDGLPTTMNLAFSSDGEHFAVGHEVVYLYSLSQGKEIGRYHGHKAQVYDICFSRDAKLIFSASYDHTVRIKEVASFYQKQADSTTTLRSVSVSPKTGVIGAVNTAKTKNVVFYSAQSGEILSPYSPEASIVFLKISFSGKKFMTWEVTKEGDMRVSIWDMETKAMLKQIPCGFERMSSNAFAISLDDQYVATSTNKGGQSIQIWDLENNILKHQINSRLPYALEFSPDKRYLAICCNKINNDGSDQVMLFDIKNGAIIETLQDASGAIYSPDGQFIAYTNSSHAICLYQVKAKQVVCQLQAHQKPVLAFSYSSDGKFLATGDSSGRIYIHDVENRSLVVGFTGHLQEIMGLWFTNNNKQLVSHGLDMIIRTWELHAPSGEIDPRLQWASSTRFYAMQAQLSDNIGLSATDEMILQQVDPTIKEEYCPIKNRINAEVRPAACTNKQGQLVYRF